MRMAKAMGPNAIGTYIFWNLHEPQRDVFDFSGNNDIVQFVRTAQEEGLWIILRPLPYVCAERGLAAIRIGCRTSRDCKSEARTRGIWPSTKKYIEAIGRQLAPYRIHRGGNILVVQIENEYGSYGSDKTIST